MLHPEDSFLSPKGIINEKLNDFSDKDAYWRTVAISKELVEYMKHNMQHQDTLVIAVVENELCFCRLKNG